MQPIVGSSETILYIARDGLQLIMSTTSLYLQRNSELGLNKLVQNIVVFGKVGVLCTSFDKTIVAC